MTQCREAVFENIVMNEPVAAPVFNPELALVEEARDERIARILALVLKGAMINDEDSTQRV